MQPRGLRLRLGAVALLMAGAALVVFVRPPRPLLRMIVEKSSGWLMSGDGDGAIKGLARAYINTSLAAHIAEPILATPGRDEEILFRMMAEVRRSVVSATNRNNTYNPSFWPALISGVGYCDQLNGVVCNVAARHFPKAELIGLYDPIRQQSPHTIGRVWSEERQDWLYFDAFYRDLVIFTRDANGQPQFVQLEAPPRPSQREEAPADIYELKGWTFADFPRDFPTYVLRRLGTRVAGLSAWKMKPGPTSAAPAPGPAHPTGILSERPTLQPSPPLPRPTKVDEELYRRVVSAYAKARVMHLLGRPDKNAYREVAASPNVARDDRASQIVATARRFAERPEL